MRASPFVRIAVYVLVMAGGFALLWWLVPGVRQTLVEISMTPPGGDGIGSLLRDEFTTGVSDSARPLLEQVVLSAVLLLSSLVFVAPIVWIYMVTKRQEGYEKTFVQVLVLLPIVVTAVVRVVRGDLALAFALAGIVAAVRFRTTLRDLKNAVFAFAAIGIGLAAGTGSFMLAGVLSTVFSVVVYMLWRQDVGGLDLTLAERSGPMRLAEALVPGEPHKSVSVGAEHLVEPLTVEQIAALRPNIHRFARFVRADALKSKRKYDTLLLVYAADEKIARSTASDLVEEVSERWNLVDTFPGPDDTTVLEYLLRLKEDAEIGEFLDELGCADDRDLRAAQLKHMKGMRDLMT